MELGNNRTRKRHRMKWNKNRKQRNEVEVIPQYHGNPKDFRKRAEQYSSEDLWDYVEIDNRNEKGKYSVGSTICLDILANRNDVKAQKELVQRYQSLKEEGSDDIDISDYDLSGNAYMISYDEDKYIHYLEMLAQNMDPESMYQLAQLYRKTDTELYLFWMKDAANQGMVQACRELGEYFCTMGHIDWEACYKWYLRGAYLKDKECILGLLDWYGYQDVLGMCTEYDLDALEKWIDEWREDPDFQEIMERAEEVYDAIQEHLNQEEDEWEDNEEISREGGTEPVSREGHG